MLVELDRVIGGYQGTAAGSAAVGDIDKGNAGKPQFVTQSVGVTGAGTAAIGELYVAPFHTRILERQARRIGALLQTAARGRAAEGVNTDTDYRYIHGLSLLAAMGNWLEKEAD